MRILIAPDAFKGSLAAADVAASIERGVKRASTDIGVTKLPLADGGEGTMAALVTATDGKIINTNVHDPLGREITAAYGILGDRRTAVIELAEASGLPLLKPEERNPLIASTYGTGELIVDALEMGIRQFIIAVGGSATNDAGTGILKALGYRFLDQHGVEIAHGGAALNDLAVIDESGVDPRIRESSFTIASDVTNPLIGETGASHVFARQKGAAEPMTAQLEQALTRFADIVKQQFNIEIATRQSAGAAGGAAGGLYALMGADIRSGFDLVAETLQIEAMLANETIDLIITGEGKIDAQSADGKVVSGVAKLGKRFNIPVIALAGAVESPLERLYDQGLTAAFSITTKPMVLQESMSNTGDMLAFSAEQIMRLSPKVYL